MQGNKDGESASEKKHLIPWGVKAREFLGSIICGEIPQNFGSAQFHFGDSVATNGGHVRCVMTDLRTSDETASAQRAAAVQEQEETELSELENKVAETTSAVGNADNNLARMEKEEKDITAKVKEAIKDYETKKMSLQNFRTKFSRFLGPGEWLYARRLR
jgi:hypothetical protein